MKLDKIKLFKRKLLIPGFAPKHVRNAVWKGTQQPESKFNGTIRQCDAGRNRSVMDIYNIVNSYFPETSLEDVLYHLARLCYKGYAFSNYCPVIQRQVFYPTSIYENEPGNVRGKSEVAQKLREIQYANSHDWDNE